jgi:hypothetical protein
LESDILHGEYVKVGRELHLFSVQARMKERKLSTFSFGAEVKGPRMLQRSQASLFGEPWTQWIMDNQKCLYSW